MKLEKVVSELVQTVEHRFYGKYRGVVVRNNDPLHLGRLTLKVPGLLGDDVVTGWAMPCLLYGGSDNLGFLCIPEKDAGVWVEFEGGDLEFPIWVGTYSSAPGGISELPKLNESDGTEQERPPRSNNTNGADEPPSPTCKILKTQLGHTIQFEDAKDKAGIIIYDGANKHIITLDKDGISIKEAGKGKSSIVLHNDTITISGKNITLQATEVLELIGDKKIHLNPKA